MKKLIVFSKSVFELIENCAKTEKRPTRNAHEITELHQKIMSMDEHTTDINDHMSKLEQGRNNPTSQEPSLAQSFANMMRTPNLTTNAIQTPPPAERLEKLEYNSSEVERRRKLLQAKVTHSAIFNNSPDLEENVKQMFAHEPNMPRCEIDDGMYVTKLPQPNTVLIKMSDHRFKTFSFLAEKQLRLINCETYNNLFINDNLTSLSYSRFRKLKSEKMR